MYKAKLYSQSNGLARRDAEYVFKKFSKTFNWESNAKILDIGCGDGSVTLEVILANLPKNFEKLICADISLEMIKFAEETIKTPKVFYRQLDITSSRVPEDFKQEFHHIFSLCCLHWVQDYKKAFQNIYDMLKPGGAFIISFFAYNPIIEVYEIMAKSRKWAQYMKNAEKFIPSYQNLEDAGKVLKELLNELGFFVQFCESEKLVYEYPSIESLRKIIAAVNPFIKDMPKEEINHYLNDFCSEMKKLKAITMKPCKNGNEQKVDYAYKLLIAHAYKPL